MADIDLNLSYNNNELPADITQQLINFAKNTLNVPPSYLITKLHYEGLWGDSATAQSNNNWGGMTWVTSWSNPQKRVSGVTVTRGTPRPAIEGGHYIKYESVQDFIKDWSYLIRIGGIYNVGNSDTFNESVKGMFIYGGAQYDYATMNVEGSKRRYELYLQGMNNRRNAINNANDGILDLLDEEDFSNDEPVDVGNKPTKTVAVAVTGIYEKLLKSMNEFEGEMFNAIVDVFSPLIYDYGNSDTKANELVKVEKIYNNVYKVSMTVNVDNNLVTITEKKTEEVEKSREEKNDVEVKDDDANPNPVKNNTPFFPTKKGLKMTSPYGWRIHPITKKWAFHGGTDWGGGGQHHDVYATQDGIITRNEWTDWGGWIVTIEHTGDQYFSGYLHFNEQSPISIGTSVKKGDVIGTMGTTGDSTGIHLHFIIATSQGGMFTEDGTIDPEVYLQMRL